MRYEKNTLEKLKLLTNIFLFQTIFQIRPSKAESDPHTYCIIENISPLESFIEIAFKLKGSYRSIFLFGHFIEPPFWLLR